MNDTNRALRGMESMKPYIKSWFNEWAKNCVRQSKYTVTTAPDGWVVGVSESFGREMFLPYISSLSDLRVGDVVWVEWKKDDLSTGIVVSYGSGDTISPRELLESSDAPRTYLFNNYEQLEEWTPASVQGYSGEIDAGTWEGALYFRGSDTQGPTFSGTFGAITTDRMIDMAGVKYVGCHVKSSEGKIFDDIAPSFALHTERILRRNYPVEGDLKVINVVGNTLVYLKSPDTSGQDYYIDVRNIKGSYYIGFSTTAYNAMGVLPEAPRTMLTFVDKVWLM